MPWYASLLLRLLLCLGASALLFRAIGAVGLVLTAPLYGAALAGPILTALGRAPTWWRWWRFRGFHGHYYAYKGRQIVVHDDDLGHRWIELPAVRQAVPDLPADARLARLYPAAFKAAGPEHEPRLRVDELHDLLGPMHAPEAIRFRNWLARQVATPAALARRRAPGDDAVKPLPPEVAASQAKATRRDDRARGRS